MAHLCRIANKGIIMKKNALIVSGSDHHFFPLLKGLVLSIRRSHEIANLPMIVLDVGLTSEDQIWLTAHNVATIRIDWDFEFLGLSGVPEYFKVMNWRPFLPKHLPDAEIYVWMDADSWIQDEQVVLLAIECASKSGLMALVPEIHPYYRSMYESPHEIRSKELSIYRACFGDDTANELITKPIINAGFFALAKKSESWSMWATVLRDMYHKVIDFHTEQCSLNVCAYKCNLQFIALPAYCNWCSYHRLPAFDEERQRLVEPGPPHHDIWLVHMTGGTKNGSQTLATTTDKRIYRSLRYPE